MIVSVRRTNWPYPDNVENPPTVNTAPLPEHGNGAAMRYVQALQEGNCDEAIALILWMQERIERSRLKVPADVADIREELCQSLTDRRIEGNQLTEEGIEDQYVFAPGCDVTLVRVDTGRDDLERPVALRAWVDVRYPRQDRAPLSLDGEPIRHLLAGINTTDNSYILKAGVVGNLEIDYESVNTDWNRPPGE